MWGISWLAWKRSASQKGLWSIQLFSRCTFCGQEIIRRCVQNICCPNCNTWALEALKESEPTLLVKVKIVWHKCNKFILLFLNCVPILSAGLNVDRRMARCLMNSELERIWKEAAGDYFEILYCHVWRNWGKPTKRSGCPIFGPRSQRQSCRIRLRRTDVPIAKLGSSLDLIKSKT
jgi:hypothetical protein